MCGVTGLISLSGNPVSNELLKRMSDTLENRGPDGNGLYLDKNVGLAHQRLSIIDLSLNANQPMQSQDGRYVISYNGEVYNYRELKKELESLGINFKSSSDTEVVLQALIKWGKDALLKFNGMFALALYDKKRKTILLARDRFGIKPLYYSKQGNMFSFASEQKSILANPDFKANLDKETLVEYFTFQNILTNKTLIKNINLLSSGAYLEVSTINGKYKETSYWDYEFLENQQSVDEADYLKELDFLFQQAVNRQLVSDVELGSYLSGGMDSGSISAIASENFPNLKTFTCGFDLSDASGIELGFDERNKAKKLSDKFATDHYETVLQSGDMERSLGPLSWHLEEPRVGQSYPNYYAAELASKHVKVVLSGSGGDELFGGYPWRYYRGASSKSFEDYIDNYYLYWQRLVNNTEIKKIFSPISDETKNVWTRDIFKNVFRNIDAPPKKPEDFINYSLYFEAKTFLHGLFIVEDKLSMAHSLETRVPFMDNDLVDFAMKCPVSFKLNNLAEVLRINENEIGKKTNIYFQKTNDGKQILRKMMKKYMPNDILEAQKQGFSSPDASWFKGKSISFVKKKLTDKNANIYNFMDHKSVNEILSLHFNGKENRRLFIWSLLNFNEYLNHNFS